MATLSKHGSEIARFNYLRHILSFRSDGTILRNQGDGWKVFNLRKDFTFERALEHCKEREKNRTRAFLDYRTAVVSEFPLSQRLVYLELSDLLGDDIDGLWASLEDSGIHIDCETLRWLHDLKIAAKTAHKQLEAIA